LLPLQSRIRDWKPVGENEIYVVLALFMLMGIVQKPTLQLHFLKNSVLAIPVFGCVISIDRLESICKFMQFNNNDRKHTDLGPLKLFKISPAMSYLNRKFQMLYILDQNIAIDESLTLWRWRLSF
jgi:hypothetical protein